MCTHIDALGMAPSLERLGLLCGIAGPAVFLVLYSVAMAGDPDYVFFNNYLSDLGVGEAAWAFNSAVIMAGLLCIPFILLGIRPNLDGGVMATLGVAAGTVGCVFLILVGVFTEDYDPTHYIVAIGFFASMLAALGFMSWSLHFTRPKTKVVTEVTQSAFAIDVIVAVFGFNPRTETVAVLLIIVWAVSLAVLFLRQEGDAPTS